EIDRWNACSLDRADVLLGIAPRENTAVNLGMQRLDPAVEHFRKAGVGADVDYGNPGIAQRRSCAPRRQNFDIERSQGAREIDDAGLVGYADQRSSYYSHVLVSCPTRSWDKFGER